MSCVGYPRIVGHTEVIHLAGIVAYAEVGPKMSNLRLVPPRRLVTADPRRTLALQLTEATRLNVRPVMIVRRMEQIPSTGSSQVSARYISVQQNCNASWRRLGRPGLSSSSDEHQVCLTNSARNGTVTH